MRVNIFKSITQIPYYPDVKYLVEIPPKFAYCSRLVVHPDHRGMRLSILMDKTIIAFAQSKSLPIFAIADGKRVDKLQELGFRSLFDFESRLISLNNSTIPSQFLMFDPLYATDPAKSIYPETAYQ